MRISSDPKETTLKLRLNEEMRLHVEKASKRANKSMSEYMRDLIVKDMKRKE